MKNLVAAFFLFALSLLPYSAAQFAAAVKPDPFRALAFLEGPWDASVEGGKVASQGSYTFKRELDNHILSRESVNTPGCKGPADFDCQHSDLMYVYVNGSGALKAIYFDNEGHVIHYDVTTPSPTTAVFLSDASQPGPQFRLTYELKGAVMSGKFQMHVPGQVEWRSYLEWSGGRK